MFVWRCTEYYSIHILTSTNETIVTWLLQVNDSLVPNWKQPTKIVRRNLTKIRVEVTHWKVNIKVALSSPGNQTNRGATVRFQRDDWQWPNRRRSFLWSYRRQPITDSLRNAEEKQNADFWAKLKVGNSTALCNKNATK